MYKPLSVTLTRRLVAEIRQQLTPSRIILDSANWIIWTTLLELVRQDFFLGVYLYPDVWHSLITVRNNLWDWQSLQVTTGSGGQFYRFCDALEVKDGVSASAKGWGVEHALAAWGNYWKTIYLSGCE